MNPLKTPLQALVVDDNRQTADSLCLMLGLLQVKARAVYGSQHALLTLKEYAPDLLLLDINMPGLSGFEVMRFVQREPHLENTQVIVVTSDDQDETTRRSLSLGARAVILKPVTLEMLEKVLAQIMGAEKE